MQNLAGVEGCDATVTGELLLADITVIRGELKRGEVPTSITGQLGRFTFRRAWRYWCVSGSMPLEVAQQLYRNPIGQKSVRASGHCGCPPPEERVTWLDEEGRTLIASSEVGDEHIYDWIRKSPEHRIVEDPEAVGAAFVTSYHIDSQEGLKLFADAIRDHDLL